MLHDARHVAISTLRLLDREGMESNGRESRLPCCCPPWSATGRLERSRQDGCPTYLSKCSHLPLRLFVGSRHTKAAQLLQRHKNTRQTPAVFQVILFNPLQCPREFDPFCTMHLLTSRRSQRAGRQLCCSDAYQIRCSRLQHTCTPSTPHVENLQKACKPHTQAHWGTTCCPGSRHPPLPSGALPPQAWGPPRGVTSP